MNPRATRSIRIQRCVPCKRKVVRSIRITGTNIPPYRIGEDVVCFGACLRLQAGGHLAAEAVVREYAQGFQRFELLPQVP